MKRYSLFFSIAVVFLLCLISSAEAQSLLTNLTRDYQAASVTWMSKAQAFALQLFYRLAAIEIAAIAMWNLFRQDGLGEFFASLLMQLMGLLFFYVLLVQAPQWIPAVVNSFVEAGKGIGNVPLDPGSIINSGIDLARAMVQVKVGLFSAPLVVATAVFSAIGVVIAYIIIGGELLLTWVEFYVIGSAGILLLGFAGSNWTRFISQGYLGTVLKIGIKLFMLYVILSAGTSLSERFLTELANAAAADGLPDVGTYFSVMAGSILFALLAWKVPNLAAGLLGGGPALGFSGAVGAVLGGASIASQITKGIVQAQSIMSNTAQAAESQRKLQAATQAGLGERKPYGERKGGLDTASTSLLSTGRTRINLAAGLTPGSPSRPAPAPATGDIKPPATLAAPPRGGLDTITAPRLPDEGGHPVSVSPRLNLLD